MFSDIFFLILLIVGLSGGFYVYNGLFKCPVTLIPASFIFSTMFILVLGGVLCMLPAVATLVAVFCAFGLVLMVCRKKMEFWKLLLFQPKPLWVFYLLTFALFFSVRGENIFGTDTIHHWGIVARCISSRGSILELITSYRDYPVGLGVWEAFINWAFFCPFRQDLTSFAYLMIYPALFLMFAGFVNWKKIGWVSILLLGCAFVCISEFYDAKSLKYLAPFLLVGTIGLTYSGKKPKQDSRDVMLLAAGFLFFLFVISSIGAFFRIILADQVMAVTAGAVLCAFICAPHAKTIIFISPAIAGLYLLKRPGSFLAIAICVTIAAFYLIQHGSYIWKAFRASYIKLHRRRYFYMTAALLLLVIATFISPLIWGIHCRYHKYTSPFKSFPISVDAATSVISENNSPFITDVKNNFMSAILTRKFIRWDARTAISSDFFKAFNDFKPQLNLPQAPSGVITFFDIFVLSLPLWVLGLALTWKKRRLFALIVASLLFIAFVVLHLFGMLLNYIYVFGSISPAFKQTALNIVEFERYGATMLSGWLLMTFAILAVAVRRLPLRSVSWGGTVLLALLAYLCYDLSFYRKENLVGFPQNAQHDTAKKIIDECLLNQKIKYNQLILVLWASSKPMPYNLPAHISLDNPGQPFLVMPWKWDDSISMGLIKKFDLILYLGMGAPAPGFDNVQKQILNVVSFPDDRGRNLLLKKVDNKFVPVTSLPQDTEIKR
ncbi:MAG: hypothetical protein PHR20_07535 [Bacteroidales bacterium]|nr:hypothetical protein [Bacteroidales bacterium]